MLKPTLCFGEIMLRLAPPDYLRIAQTLPGRLEAAFAGAEANVGVVIAQLGGTAEFITALPENPIADAALAVLRAARVETRHVVRTESGRCGVYFVETGASQRGGLVVYDREGSAFALSGPEAYEWKNILADAGWFHTTGISPGVSRAAAEATLDASRRARAAGVRVSCDLNYRRKLWRWAKGVSPDELYRRTVGELLQQVDLLVGNAQDLAAVLGESFPTLEADALDAYIVLAEKAVQRFPQLRWIALTLRRTRSASRNEWGAMLYRVGDKATFAAPLADGRYAPYVIDTIVDRVGTGDAFTGALIFALQSADLAEPASAIAFATAAGCLAHSLKGDFFYCSRAEVEALMRGDAAGHVSR